MYTQLRGRVHSSWQQPMRYLPMCKARFKKVSCTFFNCKDILSAKHQATMNRNQTHGDHIEAIVPSKHLIDKLPALINHSFTLHKVQTTVTCEGIDNEPTQVLILKDGPGQVSWLTLLAKGKESYEVVSFYPVLAPRSRTLAKITTVEEWQNHIEATITCEIEDCFTISFFATDYAWNKNRYRVGDTMYLDLAALAYSLEEAAQGFDFDGQQAIDFLSKIGKQPSYDENGNVSPVHISTEQLVAFLGTNQDYPDNYEFQAPAGTTSHCPTLGIDMTCMSLLMHRDPDLGINLYYKTSMLPDIAQGKPVSGMLWVQGSISENQTGDSGLTQIGCDIESTPQAMASKGEEYISLIEEKNEQGCLDMFENVNWLLDPLDKIKIAPGYVLDAFDCGSSYGANLQLYVCQKDSLQEYMPDLEKRKERENRLYMTAKERKKAGPFEDYIPPYDDSMRIGQRLDLAEAKQVPAIWGYLNIPFTPMGIWQAFLLYTASNLLPAQWHGMYNHRDYILEYEQMQNLLYYRGDDFSEEDKENFVDYMMTSKYLPQVDVNGDNAIVTVSYWSQWNGLLRVTLPASKHGSTIAFGEEEYTVIAHYKTDLRF